ncbi:MAG: HPr kinase/phosphorylase [Methyloceanibacter sp.]
MGRQLIHGTCVALGRSAALLRGASGAGKSDLALRFLALASDGDRAPTLIADDQVWIEDGTSGELLASAPATLAGKIEVRGLGILETPHLAVGRLVLVVDLVSDAEVPRMPPDPPETVTIAGVALPRLALAAFEPSSPLKLKLALLQAASQSPGEQA